MVCERRIAGYQGGCSNGPWLSFSSFATLTSFAAPSNVTVTAVYRALENESSKSLERSRVINGCINCAPNGLFNTCVYVENGTTLDMFGVNAHIYIYIPSVFVCRHD